MIPKKQAAQGGPPPPVAILPRGTLIQVLSSTEILEGKAMRDLAPPRKKKLWVLQSLPHVIIPGFDSTNSCSR